MISLEFLITSLIVVPLLLRGQARGAMALGSSTPSRVYGQDDLRLAEALADRAAIAIENARLYRASVEAAQLRGGIGVVADGLERLGLQRLSRIVLAFDQPARDRHPQLAPGAGHHLRQQVG